MCIAIRGHDYAFNEIRDGQIIVKDSYDVHLITLP